jgi:hypothetical protein
MLNSDSDAEMSGDELPASVADEEDEEDDDDEEEDEVEDGEDVNAEDDGDEEDDSDPEEAEIWKVSVRNLLISGSLADDARL